MDPSSRYHQNRTSVYVKRKVCDEIVSSEETYVRQLNLVIKIFEEPLRRNSIVPDYVIAQIFGNLSQLIVINNELLSELHEYGAGTAFKNLTPYLKLYATYARGHERALKTLLEWEQKNSKFADFRRQQELCEELSGLKLNALLITPVQRVPRYKLLLDQLLKSMDTEDEDYESIEAACTQVTALAEYINDHIKSYDNTQRMLEIQKRLETKRTFNIVEPGRALIKEGLVKKVTHGGSRTQQRMLFLFSDILMYAKTDMSGRYVSPAMLPLHKCVVSTIFCNKSTGAELHEQAAKSSGKLQDKSQSGGLFKISCLESQLLFCVDRKKDVESWVSAISSAIREDRRSLRKESSGKRPIKGKQLAKIQQRGQIRKGGVVTVAAYHHTRKSSRHQAMMNSPMSDQTNLDNSGLPDCTTPAKRKPMKRALDAVLSCTPGAQRKQRRQSYL